MFDVKLARDHSVVIVVSSLMALMTDQVPSVRAIKSVNSLCGIDVIVYAWKILRRHLHKSTWFYVIIKRMRKQWIPGALFSPPRLGSRLDNCAIHVIGSYIKNKMCHLWHKNTSPGGQCH